MQHHQSSSMCRARPRAGAPLPRPSPTRLSSAAAATAATDAVASLPPQATLRHALADGAELELVYQPPDAAVSCPPSSRPPVLLVHGSFHAAWCWRETFMPRLAARGFPSYAVSLRGQGGSDRRPAAAVAAKGVAGTLATHADDLASVVRAVAAGAGRREGETYGGSETQQQRAPVVAAHSFGGLILQELMSRGAATTAAATTAAATTVATTAAATATTAALTENPVPLAGAAFMGSIPPSGNQAMIGRFLRRDPWLSAKLTFAMVSASFARDAAACRGCFLSADAPPELVERVRASIERNLSPLRLIDLADAAKRVPLPPPSARCATAAPALVLRGKEDAIVDPEAAAELEAWTLSGETPCSSCRRVETGGLAHDVMLDARWEDAAEAFLAWLEEETH